MTNPTNDSADLHDAALQDVSYGSLKTHIPELLAKDTPNYLVEYGVRVDDAAMVFHFFSPKDATDWDESYAMTRRLEHAIKSCFDVAKVRAEYISDMRSFCIIVRDLGAALDPWPLVERFFSEIERGEVSS